MEGVAIADPFWSPRQVLMATVSLPLQHAKLEEYRHVGNFRAAAGEADSAFVGMFYYDSDAYKWMEAATYALYRFKDDSLEAKVEELVSLVVRSQQPDGYLNTCFTLTFPEERMRYFYVMHELYCAGHLIEAAVARNELFGKDDLLACARRFADFLVAFDPVGDNDRYVPGHQEIELALVRLYRCTGEQKYLDLAERFIDARGRDPGRSRTALANAKAIAALLNRQSKALHRWERQHGEIPRPATKIALDTARATVLHKLRFASSYLSGKYLQQHAPVKEQHAPVGHAVRATYMYSAMADLLAENGDSGLSAALEDTWKHMTRSRMYVNGGIGGLPLVEGFGRDHELDNEHAYCETCAAIGSFLWNWRMWLATGAAEYADLMELVLYNAILPGWSIDGSRYRYTNPLSSRGGFPHQEWFDCACCPPNIGRVVSSLGQYVAATDGTSTITIGQYIGCHVGVPLDDGAPLSFDVTSGFPWDMRATITVKEVPGRPVALRLRVPAWAAGARVAVNGGAATSLGDWGCFHTIERAWEAGDAVHVEFEAPPSFIFPDPRVKANRGRIALRNGPIIYCVERAGNPAFIADRVEVDITAPPTWAMDPGLLGG
ncbi:MAG: glycoside hydrolase family 127 protein, partial [Candidatus Lokiarchaeota archaeon]|nr:glycoside hydrolase family 127 protein [Candidatus Lokiarchaeota archaeon]